MVICSKLYLTCLSPERGRARRGPPFWDRSRLIDIGPKYLAPPPDHKETAGNARRFPTIVCCAISVGCLLSTWYGVLAVDAVGAKNVVCVFVCENVAPAHFCVEIAQDAG